MNRRWAIAVALIVVVVAARFATQESFAEREVEPRTATPALSSQSSSSDVERAFIAQISNVQVTGEGTTSKLLKDDNKGSRHQRFILTLASGRTLLVAHNIDLAPRIETLAEGDVVKFSGEYEWNAKGGVLHWTHHDPAGRHVGGWLEHRGKRYQ